MWWHAMSHQQLITLAFADVSFNISIPSMDLVLPLIKESLPLQRSKADYVGKLHEEEKTIFHNYVEELHFVKNKLSKNIINNKILNNGGKENLKEDKYSNNILRAELLTSDAELPNEIILNANKKDSDSISYSLEPVYKQTLKQKKSTLGLNFEDFLNEESVSLEAPLGGPSITHPSSNAHTLYIDFKRPFFYSSSNWIQKNSCNKQLDFFRVLNHSHNFTAENMKSKISEWPSENTQVIQLFNGNNLSDNEPFNYYIKSKQSLPSIKLYLKNNNDLLGWWFKRKSRRINTYFTPFHNFIINLHYEARTKLLIFTVKGKTTICPFSFQMKLFDIRKDKLLLENTVLLNCPHAFNFSFTFPALHQALNQFELHLIYNSNISPFYLFHVYYLHPLQRVDLIYKQSKQNKDPKMLECKNIKSSTLMTSSHLKQDECSKSKIIKKSFVTDNENFSLKRSSIRIVSAWSCLFYFIIFSTFILLCIVLLTLLIRSYITKKCTIHKTWKTNDVHSQKLLFQNCNKLAYKHTATRSIVSKNSKIVFVCSLYFFLFVRIFILLSLTYTFGFFLFFVHIQPEIKEYFQNMASIFSLSATQLADQLTVINSETLISSHMNDNFIKSFHAFYSEKYKSIYIFIKKKIHEIFSSIDNNSKKSYFMRNFQKFHAAYQSDLKRFTHVFKERYINDTHMHFLNYALYSKLLQKSVWLGKAKSLCQLPNSQKPFSRLFDCMGIQESSKILYNRQNVFKRYDVNLNKLKDFLKDFSKLQSEKSIESKKKFIGKTPLFHHYKFVSSSGSYEYKLEKLVSIEGEIEHINIRIIKDSSKSHPTVSENLIFEIPFRIYIILYSLDALFVMYSVTGLLDAIKKMKVRKHKNSVFIKAKVHNTLCSELCEKYNCYFENDFLVNLNIIQRRDSTSSLNNPAQNSLVSDSILNGQKQTNLSTQVRVKTLANKEIIKPHRKILWCNLLLNHLYHRLLILTVIFGFFFSTLFYTFHNLIVFLQKFSSKKLFFSFLPQDEYSMFFNNFSSLQTNYTNFIHYYYQYSCQEYLNDILAFKASLLPSTAFSEVTFTSNTTNSMSCYQSIPPWDTINNVENQEMLRLEDLTSRLIVSLTYLSSSCFYLFSFASLAYYVQRLSDKLLSHELKYNVEETNKSNENVSNNNETNDQKTSGDERILDHNDERSDSVKTRERMIHLDDSMSFRSSIGGKNIKRKTSSALREKGKSGELMKKRTLVESFFSHTEQIDSQGKFTNLRRSEKPAFKSCSSFIETIV